MEILVEAGLGKPKPEIAGPAQGGQRDLSYRFGVARRDERLVDAHQEAAIFPIDADGGGSQPKLHVEWRAARPEIHAPRAAHFAVSENRGPAVIETEDGLADAGAAGTGFAGQRDGGVFLAAASRGVEEAVEQHHAGEANGKALRGF